MLTPLEVSNREFAVRFRGYDAHQVDEFLDLVSQSYEQLFKENTELREKLRVIEDKEDDYEDIGDTLKQTLVMAQKAADDAKRNGEEKARLIIEAAENQAQTIYARAQERVKAAERRIEELMAQESAFRMKMRALLESYLQVLKESESATRTREAAATSERDK